MGSLVLGGIGLFLLGIWLMTDGLRLAAGGLLERLLASATRSPARGVLAGTLVTVIVQSSTAVTVATIGFVNAGLLGLSQSVWVVFGANVGTTLTSWLVVLIGIRLDVTHLALPMIGIGMLGRLARASYPRLGGLSQALAGFGAFFLGIGFLQEGFLGIAPMLEAFRPDATRWYAVPAFVLLGAALTVVTQSSIATITITLAASAGGAVPLPLAAAAVIGSNVGTTSTALLAAIGATAPARRVAAAHIVFNVVTAVAAIALLPWLTALASWLVGHGDIAVTVAAFHTLFNCGGLLIMAFVAGRLVDWLGRRFVSVEESIGRPRHLDSTLIDVPSLALRALVMETLRMADLVFETASARVSGSSPDLAATGARQVGILRIGVEIRAAIGRMNRQTLPGEVVAAIPDIIRGVQHLEDLLAGSARLQSAGADGGFERVLLERLRGSVIAVLMPSAAWRGEGPGFEPGAALAGVEETYQALKTALLDAVGRGRMDVAAMERAFLEGRLLRACAQDAIKARRRLERWAARLGIEPSGGADGGA